jgi:hypothetical protein
VRQGLFREIPCLVLGLWVFVASDGCCRRCHSPLLWSEGDASSIQQARYRHSELHPVPTRPAFMPRAYADALAGSIPVPSATATSTRSSEPGAPQIEMFPPSAPETAPTKPQSNGRSGGQDAPKDRLTRSTPRALQQQEGGDPWIFPAQEMRQPPLAPEVRQIPTVAGRATRETQVR